MSTRIRETDLVAISAPAALFDVPRNGKSLQYAFFGLLRSVNWKANVFYCVMAPRAANRHIPYPPALPHKFVR